MNNDEYQFPPTQVYLAPSDALWLAAWAPDPRALGAAAMGAATLRGLLAEDMPKDGQPLGGEIQHARALIDNAHHAEMPVYRYTNPEPTISNGRVTADIGLIDTGLRGRVNALENRIAALETADHFHDLKAEQLAAACRMNAVENLLNTAVDNGKAFRKRMAALLAAIYRPQPGDLVDVIDRQDDTIVTTETVMYVAADGPAIGNHDTETEFIHRSDPLRYLLPHLEDAS